jgi:hypothetical protein
MNNPLVPLLIVGMSFAFITVMALVFIVRRVVVHFLEKDRDDNYSGK